MSLETQIQWCDTTVNPVAGCNGCELYPTTRGIVREIENLLGTCLSANGLSESLRNEILTQSPTQLRRDRKEWARRVSDAVDSGDPDFTDLAPDIERAISSLFRCYASTLTARFNANGAHPGYPRTFEEPTMFSGRMPEVAKLASLAGKPRPDKIWLNSHPRLIFVSDMGDALSREISFDFLKSEIIDVVTSERGRRHLWLWLTKRPARMAEFAEWLATQQVPWPDNLVAGTSVTDTATCGRLDQLRKVPARFRFVSIEPLVEEIAPDLSGIDWVIVGGESGDHARPFETTWLIQLQEACVVRGAAFFVKQLGARPLLSGEPLQLADSHGGDWCEWPMAFRVRETPDAWRSPSELGLFAA